MKNKIINIEANYTTTLHWDMEDIAESEGFKLKDVERVEVVPWHRKNKTAATREPLVTPPQRN